MPKQAKSCLSSTFSSMNHILNDTLNVILNVLLKHVLMKKQTKCHLDKRFIHESESIYFNFVPFHFNTL